MKLDGFSDIYLANLSAGEELPAEKELSLKNCLLKNDKKSVWKKVC